MPGSRRLPAPRVAPSRRGRDGSARLRSAPLPAPQRPPEARGERSDAEPRGTGSRHGSEVGKGRELLPFVFFIKALPRLPSSRRSSR